MAAKSARPAWHLIGINGPFAVDNRALPAAVSLKGEISNDISPFFSNEKFLLPP